MTKYILSIALLFLQVGIYAQVLPLSNNYDINTLSINPAVAGSHDALSLFLSVRNQWMGFDGAPKTRSLSVHTPIMDERVGLGLTIETNHIGIFRQTSVMGNYAYRTELYPGTFSLGLGFGVSAFSDAWQNLNPKDQDDNLLMDKPMSGIMPEFSLGSYFYTKKYYVGFSLPFFLSHPMNPNTGKYQLRNKPSKYNYLFMAGYDITLNEALDMLPSVLVRVTPHDPVRIDYNVKLGIKDLIKVGLGYRNSNMIVTSLQCQLNYQILLGYSYDFNVGETVKYMNNSHEIMINYIFRYDVNIASPRQF